MRLKIGIDFHTWDGIYQGSRSHILGLYRAAIVQAPDIDFVFFLGDTESLRQAYPEFSRPNVTLVSVPHRSAPVRLLFQLPGLAKAHRLDVLHTQYRVPLGLPCKAACTIHDVLFESHPQFFGRLFVWQSRLTYRMAVRRADLLFSVSQFSKQEIVQRYGVPASAIEVTYNGVDTQRFKPGPEGEQCVRDLGLTPGQYILTVGRLEPRKNQAALIRAWSALGPDVPPLVLVGQRDFQFHDIYKAQQEAPRQAILLESVTDDQLTAVMRHARLFAYPAFAEGFGMPVAEAMASGVPVLTSNNTSLPEVAGGAAILIDPANVQAIQQGLAQGLSDEPLRQRMIEQGLARARHFSWEASAQVLVGAYRQLSNTSNRPS
jgi:glycosyltransferase involved in cell wall biosynthesis